VCAAV